MCSLKVVLLPGSRPRVTRSLEPALRGAQRRWPFLVLVFSHLTQREVARASEVCKRWRTAALSPTLWRDWDFFEVTALQYRWVQRRFLSYGLFMKARGARARSLRLLFRCGNRGPVVPLSNIQADAKPLLWHFNHFFEGIDCSELRTVLLGFLQNIGPLSEIVPVVRGAGSLRTLKLYTMNLSSVGDFTWLEFPNLRVLHVHAGEGVDVDLNCMLAACPRLRELSFHQRHQESMFGSPPFTLVSKSVEELKCGGKGLNGLRALDVPALRHITTEGGYCLAFGLGAFGGDYCRYKLLSQLKNLQSVTVHNTVLVFSASRGMHSTTDGKTILPADRICFCTDCVAMRSS
jgi:hypothetical protein